MHPWDQIECLLKKERKQRRTEEKRFCWFCLMLGALVGSWARLLETRRPRVCSASCLLLMAEGGRGVSEVVSVLLEVQVVLVVTADQVDVDSVQAEG